MDRRVFLDPKQPSLPQVARYLVDRYREGNEVHADRALVVVPGARAGRYLLDLILAHSATRGLAYWPPQVASFGALPEHLYTPKRCLASAVTQHLAWSLALQHADNQTLERIVPQAPPADRRHEWSHDRWRQLGEKFCRYYRQLAAEGNSFADVAQIVANDGAMSDSERWQALGVIQESYLRMLDRFELWDMQTARLVAVRHRECRTDRDILLVGTVDLPKTIRQMVDQVRDKVTALVYAPASWADRFDEYGTLLPDAWQSVQIPIRDEQIHIVDGPTDQANAVGRVVANYQGRFRADEIVIGIPDEQLVSYLQRALGDWGVVARWGPGSEVGRARPWRLLAACAELIRESSITAWGAIIRHPDLYEWLVARGVTANLLGDFDTYCCEHVPSTLDGEWLGGEETSQIAAAYDHLTLLLAPFQENSRPLKEWASVINDTLLSVYGSRDFNSQEVDEQNVWEACKQIQTALLDLQEIPAELDRPVAGWEAIQYVLTTIADELISVRSDNDAVELLGWLDVLHDDARTMIVTSFNEGFVPTTVRVDPFLPNSLRTQLGLDDNARRYARDAYTLQMLLGSRVAFDLVVARRAANDEPLLPSRLLFATNDKNLPYRAEKMFAPMQLASTALSAPGLVLRTAQTEFDIPRPPSTTEPITRLSATSVRQYLACPYRFYLSRVVGLRGSSDLVYEIGAAEFGTLLHDVMDRFAKSRQANSKDPASIIKTLDRLLDQQAAEAFGASPLPTARVQIAQLRRRLRAFAEVQAKRVANGWRIRHSEINSPDEGIPFMVDKRPIFLTGRIDRIDEHADGRLAILDYKTSESGNPPEETHRKKKSEWVDLQLPMYRHIARGLHLGEEFELGFVVISSDVEKVEFQMAPWSEADLKSADDKLTDVVRKIRAQEYWPPATIPSNYIDEFASICMTEVQEKPVFKE